MVSSNEIEKAREAVDSVTSETATIDCHPVVLDDTEETSDRLRGNGVSSSGLVTKNARKVTPRSPIITVGDGPLPKLGEDPEPETATITVPKPAAPTLIDADDEDEIELSSSAIISEVAADDVPTKDAVIDAVAAAKKDESSEKREPRPTITEIHHVDQVITKEIEKDLAASAVQAVRASSGSLDDETATEERPKIVRKEPARFDDETMPLPKTDLAAIGGALETVPLNAAMVQDVIAQVDARAAARASGQPVPAFQLVATTHPTPQPAPQPTPRQAQIAQSQAPMQHAPAPPHLHPPVRRLGIEILITLLAFLVVAVPALYYLYVSYAQ